MPNEGQQLRFRPRRLQGVDHEANPHGAAEIELGSWGHPFPLMAATRNRIIDEKLVEVSSAVTGLILARAGGLPIALRQLSIDPR